MTKNVRPTGPRTRLGQHLILDVWGGKTLDDIAHVERAIIAMANAAGATLIKILLHPFGPGYGVTGIAVLAESHISVHTWPEYEYAAFDIFMCGDVDIGRTVPVLEEYFAPEKITQAFLPRGELDTSAR